MATNTGFGKEGITIKPKRHDHNALRDWLRENLAGVSLTEKMFILNRMERVAAYWFALGGGDENEFEQLFNGK